MILIAADLRMTSLVVESADFTGLYAAGDSEL